MTANPRYNYFEAHSKSDTVNIVAGLTDALYVGTTGTVIAVMQTGDTCAFVGVPAGAILPISIKRVNSASTTASNFVALYER